jgi:hypothetical protein
MRISLEMQSAWTEYWKTGHFESLPGDRAAGLLGALDSAWNAYFSRLPDRAKLLDLATGGGDVIRRAIALGRGFDITGVDIADLAPVAATLQGPNVKLVGNTDLSRLPFPDSAFDGAVSQFGIEYAEPSAAAREAIRVLATGGHGHFILHHANGAITQGVINSLAAERSVFPDDSAFRSARAVFDLRMRASPAEAIALAEGEFRKSVDALVRRLRDDRSFATARGVVGVLANLAQAPQIPPPLEALRRIDALEDEVRSRLLRKQAQRDASLDSAGIAAFADRLRSAGATVVPPCELRYPGGKILAWSLSFRK